MFRAMYIDTHCHLDDPSLHDRLPEVLRNARGVGVSGFIIPGVGPDGWERIARLGKMEGVFPAFGLHPMLAGSYSPGLISVLERYLPAAAAVGEIGLDYSYADVPREAQQTAFRAQLRLAVARGLPLLIHCRRAFHDLVQILREEGAERVGGVMHAFSGSVEVAGECVRLGFAISVAGPVTYGNAVRPLQIAREIPLAHLVLETDAPDMTPEPWRGRPNEPAFLVETARKVAYVRGVSLAEVERVTTANARRLFRLER